MSAEIKFAVTFLRNCVRCIIFVFTERMTMLFLFPIYLLIC